VPKDEEETFCKWSQVRDYVSINHGIGIPGVIFTTLYFLLIAYEWAKSLDYYFTTGWKSLLEKTLAY
jgi:hypothetical protein